VLGKHSFYEGKTLNALEWWISYTCEFPELSWGRLRLFSDDSADVWFGESHIYGFNNRHSAENFLAEDEYTRFATLDEEEETDYAVHQG
jgi:hypothetical protein